MVWWTDNLDTPPLLRDVPPQHFSTRPDLDLLKCSQCLVKIQANSKLVVEMLELTRQGMHSSLLSATKIQTPLTLHRKISIPVKRANENGKVAGLIPLFFL